MVLQVPSTLRALLLASAVVLPAVNALSWNNWSTPIAAMYYSRPDLLAPAMNVSIYEEGLVEDGYVFMAPYQEKQAGPYIFDKRGNLVWSGYAVSGAFNVHNIHVCSYKGADHLCMFQGNQHLGYARGHNVIMDANYNIVKTINSGGNVQAADQHEFRLADDGKTALLTVYQTTAYDLSKISIFSQGWIQDGLFQEVDVETGDVIFEWNALNHVAPWKSYVYPNTTDVSGDGAGPETPWDYFHINSIDKSKLTGNYIISARHMSTIYNIDGKDGHIIWKLQSSADSDFKCTDFNFSFQHDAVIREENNTHMVISLYDNAFNNYNKTSDFSAGMVFVIDYEKKTASLQRPLTRWPWSTLASASQGNTQLLKNGNLFNCYGDNPFFSEHTPDGKAIWASQIGVINGFVMTYRGYSFPWKSTPNTRPSLWTYSQDDDALVAAYVSWNGATEVKEWAFYGTNDVNDPFTRLGKMNKAGFETAYTSDTHYTYMFAEALAADGTSLRNSTLVQTFVPSAKLASKCFEMYCPGI